MAAAVAVVGVSSKPLLRLICPVLFLLAANLAPNNRWLWVGVLQMMYLLLMGVINMSKATMLPFINP